ncbi:hypothetical protein FGO68_gene3488 [Halteria grandinella]|uniref:Uncharacterized protein n=1 Tax=Halteria grandinella TaxID=5974 RepID=A0A8J8TAW4_HALGN|nr:hypothetical protein FGO68_gene3488 [Halteria grandinella]
MSTKHDNIQQESPYFQKHREELKDNEDQHFVKEAIPEDDFTREMGRSMDESRVEMMVEQTVQHVQKQE